MLPSIRRAASARAALFASCLALAACHDAPIALSPAARPATPIAAGELRVALQLVDSSAGEARVALRLEHPGVAVGAYSGVVRFDPAAVEVIAAAAAPGSGTLVNARAEEPGMVRVAGFDVAAIRADVVATVQLRVRDWAALDRATTELTAAATDAGVAVTRDRLRKAQGVTVADGGAR
jgi:hypothetical protein